MQVLTRAGGHHEVRTTPPGALWPASPWDIAPPSNGMAGSGPGGPVSERRVRGIGAVYACGSVLCDGLATLPIRQFEGQGADRKEVEPSQILYDPWPEITDMDFRVMGQWGLGIRGNFIARVTDRDRLRYPSQLQPLDNDKVTVDRNTKTGMLEYRVSGESQPVRADDIVHMRNIVRPGNVLGLNPIEELRLTWALASGADAYAAQFFTNAALPLGTITVEGDLDETQTLAMAQQWMQMHQGVGSAHLPAVLTGGAKWNQLAINLADAQFVEARQMSRSEIAMIFRIPPHMISDVDKSTSWGSGIEQQELGFLRNTLGGYIRRWEIALSRCTPPGQYVEFDLRRRLRGDSVQRAAVIVGLVNAGVINRNEARVLFEDLPPADGLDAFLQPLNMGEAGTFAPPVLPKGSTSAPTAPSKRDLSQLAAIVDDVQRMLVMADSAVPAAA